MTRLTVTIYCDDPSHKMGTWEHTFSREADDSIWWPDHFEYLGEHVQKCRRHGGIEFVDAAGRPVSIWDEGRSLKDATDRVIPALDRARQSAGIGAEESLPLAHRYLIRCPECETPIRRNGEKLSQILNTAAMHGLSRIPLETLRRTG